MLVGVVTKKSWCYQQLIVIIGHYKEFLKLQRRAGNCLQELIFIINPGEKQKQKQISFKNNNFIML